MNLDLSNDEIFNIALNAENLIHGYSSGLDLKACLNGGCFLFCNNEILENIIYTDIESYIIWTK